MRYIHNRTAERLNAMFGGNTIPHREKIDGEWRVVELRVNIGGLYCFLYPQSDMTLLGLVLDQYETHQQEQKQC